jgi:hypothetical protein
VAQQSVNTLFIKKLPIGYYFEDSGLTPFIMQWNHSSQTNLEP